MYTVHIDEDFFSLPLIYIILDTFFPFFFNPISGLVMCTSLSVYVCVCVYTHARSYNMYTERMLTENKPFMGTNDIYWT